MNRRGMVAVMCVAALCAGGCERASEDESQAAPIKADPTPDASEATPSGPRTTPSGLTIETLESGAGDAAPEDAAATVEYVAMFEDGAVWDSTEKRKRAMTWDLASPNLIAGLREGVAGMRPGERRRLTIPPALGYGKNGRSPIPPNATLIFEVELVSWEAASAVDVGEE